MIEFLTPEQTAKLTIYRDKWMKIGLQIESGPLPTLETLTSVVTEVYAAGGLPAPAEVIIGDSPLAIAKMAYEKSGSRKGFKEFYSSLSFSNGQHDANWLGFYDYMLNELGIQDCRKLEPLMRLATMSGWHLFYDTCAFISRRPTTLHQNNQGQLHKDGGPALAFADGFKIFRLNGVNVPEELVMTPAHQLDPHQLGKITNAEVRREFVRKIGIQTLMDKLGAEVLDESGDAMYQLVNLNLGDGRVRPYLKMLNPSIGTYHIEGVPPGTETVKAALAWRNGGNTNSPKVLT